MKKTIIIVVLVLTLIIPSTIYFLFKQNQEPEPFFDKYVLVIKQTKNYEEAVSFAKQASQKLGVKFENENILYSKEKGIYFSEDINDPLYAGSYYPRRYGKDFSTGEDFISLENSSSYKGFSRGNIIIVYSIYDRKEDAAKALRKIKTFYKSAYFKKTKLWMGCIH